MRFCHKDRVFHATSLREAGLEISVYDFLASDAYPDRVKYSMFLVLRDSGEVVVGFDHHNPKGPHIHLLDVEHEYDFIDLETTFNDFEHLARLQGFVI